MEYFIKIKFKNEIIEGILINETKNYYVVKLKSGYNANLEKKNCNIIKKEKISNISTTLQKEHKKNNKHLPNISILHTGGTIASKVDYRTGAVSSQFSPEELLTLFPEIKDKVNITTKLITNIWSEDFRFHEYNLLLEEIYKQINKNTNAIIISQGTDTIHYTAAALQYALKNIPIPIIIVGAQRSSDRASSDAYSNLTATIDFITHQIKQKKQFRRVGICMHETINDNDFVILDSINAKKMHSTRRDAFKQINYKPFAQIKYTNSNLFNIIELRSELKSFIPNKKIEYTKYNTNLKIGFFKSHPNTFADEIKMLKYYDAVIIEGSGVGNVAEHENNEKQDKKILKTFKEISKNTKIISSIQTVYGEISLDIYSRGKDIQKSNFIGNRINLCSETLFIRTAHILSLDKNNFEKIWDSNLEGFEIKNKDIFI